MQTLAFAAGVCSRKGALLTIAHSLEYPKSGLNCCTAVNYQHGVSLVSCAIRVLQFASPITYT